MKVVKHYIYALINPLIQQPFYIGMTNDLEFRSKQHSEDTGSTPKSEVIRYITSKKMAPVVVILETLNNRSSAKKAEYFWVETFLSRGAKLTNSRGPARLNLKSCSTDGMFFHISQDSLDDGAQTSPTSSEQKPERHGAPWSATEIEAIAESFLLGATVGEIATKHNRSQSSIVFRLQDFAGRNEKVHLKLRSLGLLQSQSGY